MQFPNCSEIANLDYRIEKVRAGRPWRGTQRRVRIAAGCGWEATESGREIGRAQLRALKEGLLVRPSIWIGTFLLIALRTVQSRSLETPIPTSRRSFFSNCHS